MNPFPKAASGSYKNLLVEGLKNLGLENEAKEFENGNLKLAIVSTITGNVKTLPKLNDVCIKALETLTPTNDIRYYFWGLANNQFVVASSNGAFVYNPENYVDVAYVKAKLESENLIKLNPFWTT